MYPFLARYGSLFIYSYTVVLALGTLAAVLLTARLARESATPDWFDGFLFLLLGAIVGGRLGFVAGQWGYFSDHLTEIWRFSQGGLAYHGAWAGGIAALLIWVMIGGRDFFAYGALFMPGVALVTVFGWAACWLDGCAYGRETVLNLWSADLPDEFGVFAVRYQTQLLGLLLSLGALVTILWLRRRLPAQRLFWTAVALLGAAHLLPGLWRGDPMLMIGALRLDAILDGLMVLVGLLGIQYARRSGSA
jgi:phosphatidylglycerol:prolipoprotein diacylglycerol transferase